MSEYDVEIDENEKCYFQNKSCVSKYKLNLGNPPYLSV